MSGVQGTVYLIHFDDRYKHAGHYLGWARDLAARLAEHARGRGARLMAVIREAGIGWRLARTWPGDRARERQLKRQGGAARRCPLCGIRPRTTTAAVVCPATLPAPAPVIVAPPVPSPELAPAERGAAAARALIGQQVAAGQSPARIAAVQQAIFRDYDPAIARPAARAWHEGYQQAAARLLAALGAPGGGPALAGAA